MRLPFLSLLAAAALLVLPAAASAAVSIGGDMELEDGTATAAGCTTSFACTYLLDVTDGEPVRVPALGTAQGVVTSWQLRAVGIGARVRLRRLRVDELGVVSRGPGDPWQPIANLQTIQTLAGQLAVEPGDAVAVDVSGGSIIRDSHPGSDAGSDAAYVWSPDLGDYERRLPNDASLPFVGDLQYRVTIEPDADADGLGDETQDDCVPCLVGGPAPAAADPAPGAGAASGAPSRFDPYAALRRSGPRVKLARRAAVKAGIATVTATNPYGFALRGAVVLKLGGKRVAKRQVKLAAGASRKLGLRLNRTARRALSRQGKLALRALATFRGPVGKPRTTSVPLLVKASKPHRPRPGTPSAPPAPAPAEQSPDGSYHGAGGLTLIVNGGKVTTFSGEITTYCAKSHKQKLVPFAMFGDDPDPTLGPDGSFAYEATTNYGFVKLSYEGRISGDTATGHLNVEDRSPFSTSDGKLDFDYCYAGSDWQATR